MTHLWFVKTTTPAQAPAILYSQLTDQNYNSCTSISSTLFPTDRYPWKLLEQTCTNQSSAKELHLHGRFKTQLTFVLNAISKALLYYPIQHITKTRSLILILTFIHHQLHGRFIRYRDIYLNKTNSNKTEILNLHLTLSSAKESNFFQDL